VIYHNYSRDLRGRPIANSMDVAGKSGTPTPFLQQIADAAAQISADPKKPGWFHQPEGMDKIQKFLPPRP